MMKLFRTWDNRLVNLEQVVEIGVDDNEVLAAVAAVDTDGYPQQHSLFNGTQAECEGFIEWMVQHSPTLTYPMPARDVDWTKALMETLTALQAEGQLPVSKYKLALVMRIRQTEQRYFDRALELAIANGCGGRRSVIRFTE